jgi:hypothetical protein
MGLLDKLTQEGSPYSITGNGSDPSINVGATQQSKLHASGEEAGYSVNGNFTQEVTTAYASYIDGDSTNGLPMPSELDVNGIRPLGPLRDANTPSINNTFNNGEYLNNLPG